MKRWIAIVPLAVLAAAAVMFTNYSLGRKSHVEPDAMIGQPAPTIALPPLEGGPPLPLASQIRGPAMVNFFASWCAPCRVEHPHLTYMQAKGARLIGVAYQDDPAKTAAFLTQLGDPFDLVFSDGYDKDGQRGGGAAGIEFGITGVPETYVIDSAGIIVAKHTGPIVNRSQADALLAKLEAAR
jgi:cytochrome c biogenesis protein CcmG/thiol:disulfide interchange protein DsbE